MSLHPAASDVRPVAAFAGDRAAALGRTGRSLEDIVATYRAAVAEGCSEASRQGLLDEIAARTYRLLLQRECAGARSNNLAAIRAAYDLPDEVLQRL